MINGIIQTQRGAGTFLPMPVALIFLALSLSLSLVACDGQGRGGADNKSGVSSEPPALSLDAMPKPQGDLSMKKEAKGIVRSDPGMKKMIAQAKGDLAAKLALPLEDIDVIDAQYVTWPDASLGCPQEDMFYVQVLTNGARIQLRVNSKIYSYHSGEKRPLFYCQQPSPKAPLPYEFGDT